MKDIKTLAVIPARYASSRFPGKPLAEIRGKSMVRRTWERTRRAELVTRPVIATDDERIYRAAEAFGAEVMMTAAHHPSGTDRCAEVAARLAEPYDLVVNVQGDEPFIRPEQIDLVLTALAENPDWNICTLRRALTATEAILDPNIVKVVADSAGRALYFSREPIPHLRGLPQHEWPARKLHFQHIGLYAYRSETLQELTRLSPAPLEIAESLEQLRWLQAGYPIGVATTTLPSIGIDRPEDLRRLLAEWLPEFDD